MTGVLLFSQKTEQQRRECRLVVSFVKRGWTKSEIAQHLGRSITWVTDRMSKANALGLLVDKGEK